MKVVILLFLAVVDVTNSYLFPGSLSLDDAAELKTTCGRPPQTKSFFRGIESKSSYSTMVNRTEAPWAVELVSWNTYFCSGTLISKRHVLTAAHCVSVNPTLDKRVGGSARFDFGCMTSGRGMAHSSAHSDILFTNAFFSNNYRGYEKESFSKEHDVAILILEKDIEITENIYPACISEDNFANDDLFGIFGYGANTPNNNTDGADYESCLQTINVKREVGYQSEFTDEIRFVPLAETPFSQTRGGDSGSGLIHFANKTAIVYSVVSGGDPSYNMYSSRVSAHSKWISEVTGINLTNNDNDYYSSYKLIGKKRYGHGSISFWSNAKYPK